MSSEFNFVRIILMTLVCVHKIIVLNIPHRYRIYIYETEYIGDVICLIFERCGFSNTQVTNASTRITDATIADRLGACNHNAGNHGRTITSLVGRYIM